MMPAAKHLDPILGVDIHIIQPPGPVPPLPIPHPHLGMVFDPFDYIPFVGATVYIGGLPRAQAGTACQPMPPVHIPIGGVFVMPPGNESEMFMGSATVDIDGDAASHLVHPVLSCQSVGMMAPFRPKKPKKTFSFVLPTTMALSIPMPVFVGGPPTISLMALGGRAAMGVASRALGGLARRARRAMQASSRMRRLSQRVHRAAARAMDRLGVPNASRMRHRVHRSVCSVTGHPVDVATGKVFTTGVDLELPGPLPFRLEREWYSTSAHEGALGCGWHHSYDLGLALEDEAAVVRLADGRCATFERPVPDAPSWNAQERATLRQEASEYVLQMDATGRRYVFDVPPAILRSWEALQRGDGAPSDGGLSDPTSTTETPNEDAANGDPSNEDGLPPLRTEDWLPLKRVEDRNGNAIRFRYDARGRLTRIVDSAGRRLDVACDTSGRIQRITGPHPTDPDARVDLVRYRYDPMGRLVEVYDAHDEPMSFAYDGSLLVKETDRAGVSFYFSYDGDGPDARCTRTWGTGGIYERTLRYDTEAHVTTVTDTRGAETTYHWNDLGLVTKEVDPLGGVTETEYDADGRKTKTTDPLGHTTEYAYDDRGRLTEVTDPLGHTREVEYDDAGNPVAFTDETGVTWQCAFDAQGNVIAETDPLGYTTEYALGKHGQPIAVTDPEGHVTRLAWDGEGNLERLVDRTGAETRLAHDRLGRLIRRTDPEGGVTRLERDGLGRITTTTDAEGRQNTFRYDAGGNLTAATDALGRTRQFSYAPVGPGGVMDAVVEPSGVETRYAFDREGELTRVRDATGRDWCFRRDIAGQVFEEVDFSGRRLNYDYDAAGRLSTITNGLGQTTQIERDAAGRITCRFFADGRTETFAYDVAGRLTKAQNDSATVEFEYNARDRVVRETQNGETTEHRYDAIGNRIGRTSPTGRALTFGYDSEGRLRGVQDVRGDLLQLERDRLGREVGRHLPSGVMAERVYDRTGELLEQSVMGPTGETRFRRGYHYDATGQLERVEDDRFGTKAFIHNLDGFLSEVVYPEGTVERFTYDSAGNVPAAPVRLEPPSGDGQRGRVPERPIPTRDGNDEVSPEHARSVHATRVAGGWTLSYDADGNLIRKRNPEADYCFFYDAAGRLVRVENDGAEVARFAYDALGRRVQKKTPEKSVVYRWDGDQLLSETIRTGVAGAEGPDEGSETKREYVFTGFNPLAALSDTSDDWLFETDQVGMPRLVVNREGAVVWEADFSGFGEAVLERGDAEMSLRYPGQIHDAETGLSYNRFRYYDPESRCYTQSDPIGLIGGTSPYSYAPDPTKWVDLLGLTGSCGSASTWNEFQQRTRGWFQTRQEAATGWRVYRESNLSGNDLSLGRLADTRQAQQEGRQILDIPGEDWTPAVNDAWVQGGIDRGARFNLETPPTRENRFNPPGSSYPTTVYHRELTQLENAGYTQQGMAMVPSS